MATCVCWKHNTVTAWGCRECFAEELHAITEKVIAETRAKIRAAFDGSSPVKASLKKRLAPSNVDRSGEEKM